jgi:hypothetical protein
MSFTAIDGNRYYSLFDDAMISMRYAWNLSHGNGLVWNVGEYVEGYTNLLMVLMMSLFTWGLDKRDAVLGVQLFGVLTVLATAFQAMRIYMLVWRQDSRTGIYSIIFWTLIIFYYPLSYWSLLGMETGLLSFLSLSAIYYTLRWLADKCDMRSLQLMTVFFGLAFLARSDSLIIFAATLLFWGGIAFYRRDFDVLRGLLSVSVGVSIFVVGQLVFRWYYYGELMPNTYILKMYKVHHLILVNDGLLYSWAYIQENFVFLLLATCSLFFRSHPRKYYFAL